MVAVDVANIHTLYVIAMLITSTLTGLIITVPPASAGTSGHISSNTAWTGTIYIEGDVIIDMGVILTINPGTHVKFNGYYSLFVEGTLLSEGTGANMITFTSNDTTPLPGDWKQIRVNATGHMEMSYSNLSYMGWGIYLWDSPGNNMSHCEFNSNNRCAYIIQPYNNVTNCSFFNGNQGIFIEGNNILIRDNNFTSISKAIDVTISTNCYIINNTFWNNRESIVIYGEKVKQRYNLTIPTSNLVQNKPVYYFFDLKDQTLDGIDGGHITLAACSNVTLSNSTILVNHGDPISLLYSENCTVQDCNASNHEIFGYSVDYSDYNQYFDCSAYNNENNAFRVVNSINNNFDNCVLVNNSQGFQFVLSTANMVVNTTILSSQYNDFQLWMGNGYCTALNCQFNSNKVDCTSDTDIFNVQWFIDLHTINTTFASVPNVNVWVNNTENGTVDSFAGITDAFGWAHDVICSEYMENSTGKYYFTPHNFTVSKSTKYGWSYFIADKSMVWNMIMDLPGIDNNPPYATSFLPIGPNEPVDSNIIIQWNEEMNWASVENSFNYTDGTTVWTSVDGIWSHDPVTKISSFNPTMNFERGIQYTVTINTTANDTADNFLDQNNNFIGGEWPGDVLSWSFTTINDNPTISISSLLGTSDWTGATPHAIWWNCTDVEDKAADSLTLFLNYTSSDGSGVIAGPLLNESAKPHVWVLPAIDAADVVVHATVIDSNGAKGYFDTQAFTIDSTSPQLTAISPVNNSAGNSLATVITLIFNEPMNKAETQAAFTLKNSTATVAGTFSWNAQGTQMSFTPTQSLDLNTVYWVNTTIAAQDDSEPGNALAIFNSSVFTTLIAMDSIGPAVTIGPKIEPAIVYVDGIHDTTIWINATIDDFNLGNSTIAAAELMIWDDHTPTIQGGTGIPMIAADGTFDEMNESVTIDQDGFLSQPAMTLYYWVHGQDSDGNWGDWELVTLEIADRRLPQIASYSPTGTSVSPNSSVLFSFNEVMNHTSVYSSLSVSPFLDGAGGYFFNTGNYQDYNYTLFNKFYQNITYTITINSSIAKDTTGNFLDGNKNGIAEGSPADDFTWSFTTWADRDGDGIPDNIDPDDDNDGVNDTDDAFPRDPNETLDTDGDGIGNNADTDDDGDGVPDSEDLDPLDSTIGADTAPPSAPTYLNVTVQENGIFVKWEASPETDVHHYCVYRSTDNSAFSRISNVTGLTSFFDGDVANDTTYYYKVTAVDNASNESPFSGVEHITWQKSEQTPPPISNNDYWPYLLLMIIAVIVILAVLMVLKKKPKKPEDTENKEEHQNEVTEETDNNDQTL